MNITITIADEYMESLFNIFFPYLSKDYTIEEKQSKIIQEIESRVFDMIGQEVTSSAERFAEDVSKQKVIIERINNREVRK